MSNMIRSFTQVHETYNKEIKREDSSLASRVVQIHLISRMGCLLKSSEYHAEAVSRAIYICFLSITNFFAKANEDLIQEQKQLCLQAFTKSFQYFFAFFNPSVLERIGKQEKELDILEAKEPVSEEVSDSEEEEKEALPSPFGKTLYAIEQVLVEKRQRSIATQKVGLEKEFSPKNEQEVLGLLQKTFNDAQSETSPINEEFKFNELSDELLDDQKTWPTTSFALGSFKIGTASFLPENCLTPTYLSSQFELKHGERNYPGTIVGIAFPYEKNEGPRAAAYFCEKFSSVIQKELQKNEFSTEGIYNSLQQTFIKMHQDFIKKGNRKPHHLLKQNIADQGCSAIVAMILNDNLWIANVGNTKAIFTYNGVGTQLSTTPNPTNPAFQERIESLGGSVENNRLNGTFPMASTFGHAHLDGTAITVPEIIFAPLDQIEKEEAHLILGSADALAPISKQQLAKFVQSKKDLSLATLAQTIIFPVHEDVEGNKPLASLVLSFGGKQQPRVSEEKEKQETTYSAVHAEEDDEDSSVESFEIDSNSITNSSDLSSIKSKAVPKQAAQPNQIGTKGILIKSAKTRSDSIGSMDISELSDLQEEGPNKNSKKFGDGSQTPGSPIRKLSRIQGSRSEAGSRDPSPERAGGGAGRTAPPASRTTLHQPLSPVVQPMQDLDKAEGAENQEHSDARSAASEGSMVVIQPQNPPAKSASS
jgi:serine/threonine protein phosphatase PrpC